MKNLLIRILEALREEKTHIVKETYINSLHKGDIVFINGSWCEWVSGYLERTLYHVFYYSDNKETVLEFISETPFFLQKIEINE